MVVVEPTTEAQLKGALTTTSRHQRWRCSSPYAGGHHQQHHDMGLLGHITPPGPSSALVCRVCDVRPANTTRAACCCCTHAPRFDLGHVQQEASCAVYAVCLRRRRPGPGPLATHVRFCGVNMPGAWLHPPTIRPLPLHRRHAQHAKHPNTPTCSAHHPTRLSLLPTSLHQLQPSTQV